MSEINASKIIQAFVQLRDKRAEMRHAWEEEDKKLEEKQDKCKAWLAKTMADVGTDQLKGADGTAFRQVKSRFNGKDWPSIWNFIKENDRFDMLQKRLGETALKNYLEETGTLPPGVDVFQEYEIVVRRS